MRIRHCSSRPVLNECPLESCTYQIDPYVGCAHLCHYCYALNGAETDWSQEILYYEEIETQLATEIEGVPPQSIYMGWKTDPYQPCEEELEQTRRVIEYLHSRGFSVSILTKSNLILRDLDILKSMRQSAVSLSVAFDDESTRMLFEDNTMSTQTRIQALEECKKAGLRISAMVCPVIPYVNDPMPIIEKVVPFVDKVWVYGLSILNESEVNWKNVERILRQNYPSDYDEIRNAIFDKAHHYWADLKENILGSYSRGDYELSVHF